MTRAIVLACAAMLGATAAAGQIAAPPPPPPSTAPAATATAPSLDPLSPEVNAAAVLVASGKPAEAIVLLDAVIAGERKAYARERRTIYSARTLSEPIAYAALGAGDRRDTIIVDQTWSLALFLKGFALIDVGRAEEAGPFLEQAIALAPLNAQYLNEYGEYQKNRKDFAAAHAAFAKAADAAPLSRDEDVDSNRHRAWRGMAFALSEQGQLDAAEALYRKCLAEDPGDAKAAAEIDWIAEQRKKAS